jgi:hypothetical protein
MPDFKLSSRAIVTETVALAQKTDTQTSEQIEDLEKGAHNCSHLIFTKGWKETSSTNDVGKTGYPHTED